MHINPAEIISDKKLLVLNNEEIFEPLIYSLLSSFDLNFPEYHSHKILDGVKDSNKMHSVQNMDKTLEFCTKICKVHQNNHETIKIKMENMIYMMHSFNLSCIDEEIEKNED